MALLVYFREPVKGRSVKRVYSRLFAMAREILDVLGVEVVGVEVAKLRLVKRTEIDRKELGPEVIPVKLDRRFRFREKVDLSEYTWKYSDGYVSFFASYNGERAFGTAILNVGIPKRARKPWGDLTINLHNNDKDISGIIPEGKIAEALGKLDFIGAWHFD